MSNPIPTPTIATSFAQIIKGLAQMLGRAYDRDHSLALLISLITTRLYRMRSHFATLAARAAAGTLPAPRKVFGSEARCLAAAARPKRPNQVSFGWMGRLAPGTGGYGSELQRLLLDDAEMAGLLAEAPQLGRMLRSILWMTGIKPVPERLRLACPARGRRIRRPSVAKPRPPAPVFRERPSWETPYRPSAQWPKGCVTKRPRPSSGRLATVKPPLPD